VKSFHLMENYQMSNLSVRRQLGDSDLLAIGGHEVVSLLEHKEQQVVEIVKNAYRAHDHGDSSLPFSSFLRFPNEPTNRIIALPAYLGGGTNAAGIKWIASFPANVQRGLDRASAVLVINSMTTGRPKALLEASVISAVRTAASAALAARVLRPGKTRVAGLIGCGVINFEVARFLLTTCPDIERFLLFDLDPGRSRLFQERCAEAFPTIDVRVADDLDTLLESAALISFATTAIRPYVPDLKLCAPGAVVLHISLRDLLPEAILSSDNVVDDIDHVCRAETSIHLTEQRTGNRRFIRCTLGQILTGTTAPRSSPGDVVIFSPFGLGILDLAVGEFVLAEALANGKGEVIRSFFPDSWNRTAISNSEVFTASSAADD
jgi:2,3-diaminopropionate biosynthesis protein SbnB